MHKDIEINPLFERALRLMEESENNVFITGRAGTGKSTLLDYFRSITDKEIVVLAPTGVAAVNVAGQTIHSFFGFRPDVTVEKVKKEAKKKAAPIYMNVDTIVIDEISMVRADLLDCVDAFLRINGRAPGFPFGGVQMVFIGDLYQIPPVATGHDRKIFREHYESEYFFDAKVYDEIEVEYLELEKIYRQTDQTFVELLNRIRNKTASDEDIELINRRVVGSEDELPKDTICLTTTNAIAEQRNESALAGLPGKPRVFRAEISGEVGEKYFPADEVLRIKKNAQVMLLNNDPAGRWINGTIGTVNKITPDYLEVRLQNGAVAEITPFTWKIYRFSWNEEMKSVESEAVGSFKQFPVKLAWAITIHKSQGKTFDNIAIDLGSGAFASGQLYVALSRCRSLDGIFLKRKIKKSDIWTDWRVAKFITWCKYDLSEKELPLDEKVRLIEEAIENGSLLDIIYLTAKDEKTQRVIKPESVGDMEYMGKSFIGTRAYCFKRKEHRSFRIDRILTVREVGREERERLQLLGSPVY